MKKELQEALEKISKLEELLKQKDERLVLKIPTPKKIPRTVVLRASEFRASRKFFGCPYFLKP